jgi:NitT/TauT family transport system substrate-binding protein
MKRIMSGKMAAVLVGTLLTALRLTAAEVASLADDAELVEARSSVPRLKAAAAYEPAEGVIRLDLSEYAGYAGILAANGGLEPNEDSIFFKKHKLKVRIAISEEDAWSPLNSGQMAASGTTADVLPLYGAQLQAVTPLLIAFSRGADGVVVRQEIKQVNDLKGKVLAVAQFNESDFFIRYLAQQAGLEVAVLEGLNVKPLPDRINLVACADSFGAGDLFLRDLNAGRTRLHGCVTWDPKTTEVVEGAKGKARLLITNRNLLIVADILLVNRGFAEKHPEMVRGLVEGILEGNDQVRRNPAAHRALLAKAFKWAEADVAGELAKVHLANLPENLAFFNGTIDAAGSYGYIYESAVLAYGSGFIPRPIPAAKFLDLKSLESIQAAGLFADQKPEIKPIRSGSGGPVEDPLLMRDIRFLFKANSSELDRTDPKNVEDLKYLAKMLQVSPGSTLLLRGHVDNGLVKKFEKDGGPALVQKMAIKAVQLSKERCESVAKALVEMNQVDGSRLESIGCGWKEPLGTDGDQNRRVEVQWFTIE